MTISTDKQDKIANLASDAFAAGEAEPLDWLMERMLKDNAVAEAVCYFAFRHHGAKRRDLDSEFNKLWHKQSEAYIEHEIQCAEAAIEQAKTNRAMRDFDGRWD